jgi:hypothetical protein
MFRSRSALIAFLKFKSPERVISCGVCIHAREGVIRLGFHKTGLEPRIRIWMQLTSRFAGRGAPLSRREVTMCFGKGASRRARVPILRRRRSVTDGKSEAARAPSDMVPLETKSSVFARRVNDEPLRGNDRHSLILRRHLTFQRVEMPNGWSSQELEEVFPSISGLMRGIWLRHCPGASNLRIHTIFKNATAPFWRANTANASRQHERTLRMI